MRPSETKTSSSFTDGVKGYRYSWQARHRLYFIFMPRIVGNADLFAWHPNKLNPELSRKFSPLRKESSGAAVHRLENHRHVSGFLSLTADHMQLLSAYDRFTKAKEKGKLLSARTLRPSDVFTWLNSSFPVFLLGNQNAGLRTHAFPFSASCQEALRSFQTSRSSTCTFMLVLMRDCFLRLTQKISKSTEKFN